MVAEDRHEVTLSGAEPHSAVVITSAEVHGAEGVPRLGMVGLGAEGAPRPNEVVAPIGV